MGLLICCMACGHRQKVPVNIYNFNFSGYDQSKELRSVYDQLLDEFGKYNYCITPDQQLIYLPKDSIVDPSLLDKLHPALHQVAIFDSTKNYKSGTIRIDVKFFQYGPGDGIQVSYTWYTKTKGNKWHTGEDFGKLTLHRLTSGSEAKRKHFLGTEFARETFR